MWGNRGTPVKASAQGAVLASMIIFSTARRSLWTMATGDHHVLHLDRRRETGEAVSKGQLSGFGKPGAPGPHLHWSVVMTVQCRS